MPFEMRKIRVEEVRLENKEFDSGHVDFEKLAKRHQEAIWKGKVRSLHLM